MFTECTWETRKLIKFAKQTLIEFVPYEKIKTDAIFSLFESEQLKP